ncbi:MAG: Ig-like domain-containing protein, partial [Pirellulales bacterium]|nr:Ig-like domain-containing protein [Pirellulales bacterium]
MAYRKRSHRSLMLRFRFSGAAIAVLLFTLPVGAQTPPRPVSFVNDVMPVLTKAGCNTGVCHAKAGGGQNGFALSLLGFEPQEDYAHLTRQGRGRRLFPAAPDRSLLLQKASGSVPHGGGIRLRPGSHGYQTLLQWIDQGTPNTISTDPVLERIEVQPPRGKLDPGGTEQLSAWAHYSDGSRRDVTSMALYESNDTAMADVTETGLVTAERIPGKVSVMVRYQGKVSVYSAAIPLGVAVENFPETRNVIDELVFANLKEIGIPPSPVCDDATFLRRVSLDIAGRIPSEEEARRFLADDDPDKRAKVIEALLRSPDYADYFANKWTSLLKNRRDDASDITSNFAFHAWIRDGLLANVPYDQ